MITRIGMQGRATPQTIVHVARVRLCAGLRCTSSGADGLSSKGLVVAVRPRLFSEDLSSFHAIVFSRADYKKVTPPVQTLKSPRTAVTITKREPVKKHISLQKGTCTPWGNSYPAVTAVAGGLGTAGQVINAWK